MLKKKTPLEIRIVVVLEGSDFGKVKGFSIYEDGSVRDLLKKGVTLFKEMNKERYVFYQDAKYFYVVNRFFREKGVGYKEMIYSTKKPSADF